MGSGGGVGGASVGDDATGIVVNVGRDVRGGLGVFVSEERKIMIRMNPMTHDALCSFIF